MRRIMQALAAAAALWAGAAHAQATRPNVVILLIDDAGFTDLGAYGGEARTPNIDRLAARGAQFSRYYTSPLCSPSRAMLLTGVDNHRTGLATIPEVLPPEHVGRPGYSMRLEPGLETVALRLREAGYRTYITGKWHLGHGPGDLPNAHGFDRSFVLDASGADNWSQQAYMPYYAHADWFEDGAPARLPDNFYSSQFIVDRMIDYLDQDARADAPFFAYLGFQAVHIPVQAPSEFTANYIGLYDQGWEPLRQARWRRAQELGLIPQGAPIAQLHSTMRAWDDVDSQERALLARAMAVHAGMLEAMDHHIGRLIAHLERTGRAQNTIFIVTSDNGPEPSDPMQATGFAQWLALQGYSRRVDNLGERGSYAYIGPEFASATASPGALFKFYATEGGVHAPLIAAGPGVAVQRTAARAFVTDIAPTILEWAGLAPRAREGAQPISGVSLRAVLEGRESVARAPDDAIAIEVSGNAALYRGDYKITRTMAPYGDGRWRLYDLAADPGETRDLSAAMPEIFAQMQQAYADYARANGVLDLPEGYEVHRQVEKNTLAKLRRRYAPVLAAAGAGLLALIGAAVWFVRRRQKKAARAGAAF
ncbi:MAG: sulfatase-like hydrolase/transferase [Alphaproteobacteria bacterium]|nr:sulfatase-like hydrolase/transferase [Alphaproteobacteria bacterium]